MSDLKIAPNLSLPEHFATEGVVAIGMRGSGKSNTLVRWAEVLYKAKIPFVAIDPKGDWYGIKSSVDGKAPGLSVPIFGGLHEDFPLTETLGVQIADLLVDQNMSAVLDVSRLSISKRAVFLTAFCNRLMDRHQQEPHVRCVIFEEAHKYIPQNIPKGPGAACKEATASLLLEGRAFGLGAWAATQRPARLHKDVLEEVGTVFLHRVGAAANNDIDTIKKWLTHESLGQEIVASLTRLEPGEAWVLSPSEFDIVQRVRVDRRQTYDTGATPLVGAGSRPTLTMADIDATAIKQALSAAIEKAKENDPKELKAEVARLRREFERVAPFEEAFHRLQAEQPEVIEKEVEVEVVPEDLLRSIALLDGRATEVEKGAHEIAGESTRLKADIERLTQRARVLKAKNGTAKRTPERTIQAPTSPAPQVKAPPKMDIRVDIGSTNGDIKLGKAERAILTVLAQHGEQPEKKVAILAGYTHTKGFTNAVSSSRTKGLVEGGKAGLTITAEGRAALGEYEPLPDDLFDYWLHHEKVGKCERAIMEALQPKWPGTLDLGTLADQAEYPLTKGFTNSVSKLRTLDIIEGGRDAIRLVDTIMEGH